MANPDIAAQWKSFDPEKRDRLLKKMSPEQKKKLRGILEGSATQSHGVSGSWEPNESTLTKVGRGAALGAFEGAGIAPAASAGEVLTGTAKQTIGGIKDLLTQTFEANALPGFKEGPAKYLDYPSRTLRTAIDVVPTFIDKTATALEQGGREAIKAAEEGDWETAAEKTASTLTTAALLRGGGKTEHLAPKTVGDIRASLAPTRIPIAGEEVPVLVGEASPDTFRGRLQTGLKRAGIGAKDFSRIFNEQQAKFKEIVRKVGKQTSGDIGPSAAEPATAMSNAADATFAKARPMYNALDSSLATVPDAMSEVSKVTQQAITRARKLGAEVTEGAGEEVVISGRKFTPQTDPVAWQNLKAQGLVPDTAGQPISTYMKVRSELLKMQRSSSDGAIRYKIGKEVEAMNRNMESALANTPLLDSWHEANRLWSKGYAIRDVADAIRESTQGTPAAEQAPGLTKTETTVKGAQLVKRLNELKQDGILERAFSPDEVKNLRQSADILDRASSAVGGEFKVGYGIHSTIWRNVIGLPFIPVVKAMTTDAGVSALRSGNFSAFSRLVTGAAVTSSNVPSTPAEARKQINVFSPVAQ